MKTLAKYFLYFMIGIIIVGLLQGNIIYGLLLYLIYFIVKKARIYFKEASANKKLAELKKAETAKIEYKVEYLLKSSDNFIEDSNIREAYRNKTSLSLQDKWYLFLDLRAKLELNNTPTGKAEAVLHIMCDEITTRIQRVDVELTDLVKKEFIEGNLTPLLDDVNEILSGIKHVDAIDVNAYDLLKNYDLEKIG